MFKLKKKSKKKILNFGYLNKKNLKDLKKKTLCTWRPQTGQYYNSWVWILYRTIVLGNFRSDMCHKRIISEQRIKNWKVYIYRFFGGGGCWSVLNEFKWKISVKCMWVTCVIISIFITKLKKLSRDCKKFCFSSAPNQTHTFLFIIRKTSQSWFVWF